MANDFGPSVWLEAQYDRFMQGVDALGSPAAVRLREGQSQAGARPDKEPRISIPAWDDIIRTGPRTPVSEDDWALHKHFEQADLPSPLSPDKQQAIAERREIAKRIANSAIPDYQKGVSAMLTAVDNVQDAALTFTVAGRLTIAALGQIGFALAPAVAGLATLATMLNWLGLALVLFGILYALACGGWRSAGLQGSLPLVLAGVFKGVRAFVPRKLGIPVYTPTMRLKGKMGAAMFGIPSGRQVDMYRRGRWESARVGFGELLQIGQFAYDATGRGVALGAMMGFIGESVYGTARALAGEKVTVRSPQVNHEYAKIVAPTLTGLKKGPLYHKEQCARALASAPIILRDPWTFGDQLYGLTWIVVYSSIEPLLWDTERLPWRAAVLRHLPAAWRTWDVRDPVTRGLLEENGLDPDAPAPWPVAGSPLELDSVKLVRELGDEISASLRRWLEEDPTDAWRRFVAELAMRTTERLWVWLEGAGDWPSWSLAPTTAVWESLFIASRWPIVSDPPDRIMAAWAASERAVEAREGGFLDGPELDRIWEAHGVPLLRLTGGPPSGPVENLIPWDPTTGEPGELAQGATVAEARAKLAALLAERGPQRPQEPRS